VTPQSPAGSHVSPPIVARNKQQERTSKHTALVRQGRLVARELRHGLSAADAALEAEMADGASRNPVCIEDAEIFGRLLAHQRRLRNLDELMNGELQIGLNEAESALNDEFADGASRNSIFIEEQELLHAFEALGEGNKSQFARKDSSNYFMELETDTNLRVCAVCSQEKNARDITPKSYDQNDEIFKILCLEDDPSPVLSIPSELRWDLTVPDEENMRLQRYRLRVCEQCLRCLKKGRVPKESVRAIPLNYFYGFRNGTRELSIRTIEMHKELFRTMSPTTRSLLSLVRPVYTVITVRHYYCVLVYVRQSCACMWLWLSES